MAGGFQTMQTLSFILPMYFCSLQLAACSVYSLFPCGSSQQPCLRNVLAEKLIPMPFSSSDSSLTVVSVRPARTPTTGTSRLISAGTRTAACGSPSSRPFSSAVFPTGASSPALVTGDSQEPNTWGVWMLLRHSPEMNQLPGRLSTTVFS